MEKILVSGRRQQDALSCKAVCQTVRQAKPNHLVSSGCRDMAGCAKIEHQCGSLYLTWSAASFNGYSMNIVEIQRASSERDLTSQSRESSRNRPHDKRMCRSDIENKHPCCVGNDLGQQGNLPVKRPQAVCQAFGSHRLPATCPDQKDPFRPDLFDLHICQTPPMSIPAATRCPRAESGESSPTSSRIVRRRRKQLTNTQSAPVWWFGMEPEESVANSLPIPGRARVRRACVWVSVPFSYPAQVYKSGTANRSDGSWRAFGSSLASRRDVIRRAVFAKLGTALFRFGVRSA